MSNICSSKKPKKWCWGVKSTWLSSRHHGPIATLLLHSSLSSWGISHYKQSSSSLSAFSYRWWNSRARFLSWRDRSRSSSIYSSLKCIFSSLLSLFLCLFLLSQCFSFLLFSLFLLSVTSIQFFKLLKLCLVLFLILGDTFPIFITEKVGCVWCLWQNLDPEVQELVCWSCRRENHIKVWRCGLNGIYDVVDGCSDCIELFQLALKGMYSRGSCQFTMVLGTTNGGLDFAKSCKKVLGHIVSLCLSVSFSLSVSPWCIVYLLRVSFVLNHAYARLTLDFHRGKNQINTQYYLTKKKKFISVGHQRQQSDRISKTVTHTFQGIRYQTHHLKGVLESQRKLSHHHRFICRQQHQFPSNGTPYDTVVQHTLVLVVWLLLTVLPSLS